MANNSRGQISLRPTIETLERLEDRARLSGQRKTTLAERYLLEGLVMDEFPGIQFVDGPMGRRPALIGTGLDVWEVVKAVKDGGSVEEAAAYLEVEPAAVSVALNYYGSNREEIDDWLARVLAVSEREEAKWHASREILGL